MSVNKNMTMEQFKQFASLADERLDKLELGKADKVSPVGIIIPASAWTENTDVTTATAGSFYADVAVEGLTAENIVDTMLDYSSLETAKKCGMANNATSMVGKMRYYAVKKPVSDMNAILRVSKSKF